LITLAAERDERAIAAWKAATWGEASRLAAHGAGRRCADQHNAADGANNPYGLRKFGHAHHAPQAGQRRRRTIRGRRAP